PSHRLGPVARAQRAAAGAAPLRDPRDGILRAEGLALQALLVLRALPAAAHPPAGEEVGRHAGPGARPRSTEGGGGEASGRDGAAAAARPGRVEVGRPRRRAPVPPAPGIPGPTAAAEDAGVRSAGAGAGEGVRRYGQPGVLPACGGADRLAVRPGGADGGADEPPGGRSAPVLLGDAAEDPQGRRDPGALRRRLVLLGLVAVPLLGLVAPSILHLVAPLLALVRRGC